MRVAWGPKGDAKTSAIVEAIEGLRGGVGSRGEGCFQSAPSGMGIKEPARLWRNGPRSRVDNSIGDNKQELCCVRAECRFMGKEEMGSTRDPSLSFDVFDSLAIFLGDKVATDSCGEDVELPSELV